MLVVAVFAFVATSCNKENVPSSKSDIISVKVSGANPLSTRSDGVHTMVLEALEADAPSLYMVSSPYESDALSTKSAAITGSTLASFTLDAFVDGKSGKYLDKIEATYNSGDGKWTLGKNKDGEPCTWSWDAEKGKYSDIAFWAWACDESIGSIQDKLSDNSSSMSFSYSDFVQSKQGPYTKDLLVAYNKKNEGTVEFKFAHALAAVSAFVDPEQEPDAKIVDCSFNNVLSQGNCTCTPAGEGVSFAWTASKPVSYAASFDGSSDALSQDNFHFIIPQSLGADATVTITVEKNGVPRTHTYSLARTKWEAGKKYVYRLGYPSGAVLMNGPAFWDAINELVSNSAVIENVEFKVASPISDYPSLPYTMVQDPTSKAKIYAVYDSSSKSLIVTTGADEMFTNVSMEKMFYGYKTKYSEPRDGAFGALKSIDFGPLNTVKTTNMKNTFGWNVTLTSADLNTLNVSNVTTFDHTFFHCGFSTIDITSWETSSATDMQNMFGDCQKMEELLFDPKKFDVSNVTFMHYMFNNCFLLKGLDLRSWDTKKLNNTQTMFSSCRELETLLIDTDKFNTEKVTNMAQMFQYCYKLKSIDVSKFVTKNVQFFHYMFTDCTSLTSLDIRSFSTEKATQMEHMFDGCTSITEIKIDPSKFKCNSVTTMDFMFRDCKNLGSLDLSGLTGENCTITQCMFQGCKSLPTLDLRKFQTSKVTNAAYMFQNCESLNPLQVDNTKFTFDAATTMEHMFDNCNTLETIDVTGFKTSNVTTMAYMFYLCQSLGSVDVTKFDTGNVTNMESMFRQCIVLQNVDVSHFKTDIVTTTAYMFAGCYQVQALAVEGWNVEKVEIMDYMFDACWNLVTLDVSHFNTGSCTSFTSMFQSCYKLKVIDVSGFNTSAAEYLDYMFNGCYEVETLDTSRWNTAKVKRMDSLFQQCKSLKSVNLLSFNTANTWNMSNMFMDCFSLEEIDLSSFNTASVNSSRQGSLGGMFAVSGQTADYKSVLRKITLGTYFVIANDAKKNNLMQYTGKDIAAGVIICTDATWASIINQPTLTSTGTQINLAKWNHVSL